jgi:gliding motility-associated-like protein
MNINCWCYVVLFACITAFSFRADAQCDTIHLADTVFVCPMSTDTLHASVSGPDTVVSILWSPSMGLSDTTVLNPAVTVGTVSGWYYFAVTALDTINLVVNGNFSAGNTGFSSSYTYVTPSPTALFPEALYTIDTDPSLVHPAASPYGDHTTGTGNMMIVNGAGTAIDVWCETITVTPNTNYDFSAWVSNWGGGDVGSGIPILQFKINGVLIGTPDTTAFASDVWHQFHAIWNSGVSTTATICIYDECIALGGNDFALDDIAFHPLCVTRDSVYVDVTPTDTVYKNTDTLVCSTVGVVTLNAPAGFSSYLWNSGSTATSFIAGTSGVYWVRGISGCNEQTDTTHLTILPLPAVSLGNDTSFCFGNSVTLSSVQPVGYTFLWSTGATGSSITVSSSGTYWLAVSNGCIGSDTIHITVLPADTTFYSVVDTVCASALPSTLSAPGGYTGYTWNTGSNLPAINVVTSGTYWVQSVNGCNDRNDTTHFTVKALPVVNLGNDTGFCAGNTLTLNAAQPAGYTWQWSDGSTGTGLVVSSSGSYWLTASNGCVATDTIHVTVSVQPTVLLGNDSLLCFADSLVLQSTLVYGAPSYIWSNGATTPEITVNATGTYWLQVSEYNCPGADTVHLIFVHDTLHLFNPDTAICRGMAVQVRASASPLASFQWLPTAGIGNSTALTPLIIPDTSALYVLSSIYPGCPVLNDSLFIDVQPNPQVFAGFNRFVCQNDTLHITANVAPAWYTHYSYSWSPGNSVTDSTSQTVVFSDSLPREMVVTVSTPAGCSQKDSLQINVEPSEFLNPLPDLVFCPGDSAMLQPTATSSVISYRWVPTLYLSDSTSGSPILKPITSSNYLLVGTNQYGCRDSVFFHVKVNPSAVIYLGDSVTVFPGEHFTIANQTNCTSFKWFPPYGLSDATAANPTVTADYSTKYVVTGATIDGCTTTDSIMVYLSSETLINVPNIFTPGNGVNNEFKVVRRGLASLNYFRVYNRWGNLVYESSDINKGWDGSYMGTPQPFDVYVYMIQAVTNSGEIINRQGNVTLLR